MQQVLFIHGGGGFSNYDDFLNSLRHNPLRNPTGEKPKRWSGALREDLGESFALFQPSMPNSENAKYEEWKTWLERHFEYLADGVILVGWSLGGMFLAKYLLENDPPFQPKSLFLLAAPAGYFVDEKGEDCGTFRFDPKNITNLATKVPEIEIWHSTDDFVVPYEHALVFSEALPTAKLVTFSDRNHFLQESFPELVEAIKKVK